MVIRTLELVRAIFSFMPSKSTRRRSSTAPRLVESLEARQLMSTVSPSDGFFNITGSLVSTTIPASIGTGSTVKGAITVAVKNAGTLALPSAHPKEQVTIEILAHKSGGGDTVVVTSKALTVSQIAAGNSQNFTLNIKKLPILAAGDYTYTAVITPVQALAESSTADNTITTTAANATLPLHVITAAATGTLGDFTLPSAIVAGNSKAVKGVVNVVISNSSNIALPAGQTAAVLVEAHNTVTHANIVLSVSPTKKYSLSSLGIGRSETIAVNVQAIGKKLPAGTYILEAQITPVQKSGAAHLSSSLVTLNSAGLPVTLVSGAATADLTGKLGASTVVSTSSATSGNLTITVVNSGNLPIATSNAVTFSIVARPVGTLDNSADVALTTSAQNLTIPSLLSGKSATFTVNVNSNVVLPAGSYNLLATISAPGITQPTVNDIASQTAAGTPVRVTSTNVGANNSTGNGNTTNTGSNGNTTNTGGDSNTTNSNGNTTNTGSNGNTTNTGGDSNTTNSNGNTTNTGGDGNTTNTGSNGNTTNTGGDSNTTSGFNNGVLTVQLLTVDIANASGTVTISDATFGGDLSAFSISDVLTLESNVTLSGAGHNLAFVATPNTNTGTLNLDGTSYDYTVTGATIDSLTLAVTPVALIL